MLLSPLDLDSSPIQRNKNTKNGSRNSQTMSPKSVSFFIETPLQVKSKPPKGNFTGNLGENMRKHKLNIFASRSRCKIMFQALDNRGRQKLNSQKSKTTTQEDQLNITDSFQYRIESLLEEGDYVLDISRQKKPQQTPAPIGLMIPLHRKKRTEMKLEKTKLKARRKSDISLWSGGVSELENKTVFMTFEYISKPITVIDAIDTSYVPKFNRETERFSALYRSPGLGIPDGTPTRVSALARLDGTPSRLSALAKHDSTPVSVGRKYLNSSMKAWSAKLLDFRKENSDDKNSPFLQPFRTPAAKGRSFNEPEDEDSDESSERSGIKYDKISNPSAISSPYFNDDPKTPSNFDSAVVQLQSTFSGAISKDSATLKHPSSHILSTHLLKSDSEKITHQPMPLVIQPSKSQERFRPFKAGPNPLPVYLKDHSTVKIQRPAAKMTPGSVIIPRHRKNLSLGGSEGDNSASFKMSMMLFRNDSVLNSNDNSPARGSSKDTKKFKDFKKILEQHKSNRTKVLLKLQKKLVAKVYSPENSVIIPNPKMLNMTSEVKKTKTNNNKPIVPKEKKSFFIDSISPNETAILPKVPTSRRGHSHSMSLTAIKPHAPLTTSNSKRSLLDGGSKLKFSGLHGHSASMSSNIDLTKMIKAEKAEKPEKERTKSLKAAPKFKPKISQPKQLRISYAKASHQ